MRGRCAHPAAQRQEGLGAAAAARQCRPSGPPARVGHRGPLSVRPRTQAMQLRLSSPAVLALRTAYAPLPTSSPCPGRRSPMPPQAPAQPVRAHLQDRVAAGPGGAHRRCGTRPGACPRRPHPAARMRAPPRVRPGARQQQPGRSTRTLRGSERSRRLSFTSTRSYAVAWVPQPPLPAPWAGRGRYARVARSPCP